MCSGNIGSFKMNIFENVDHNTYTEPYIWNRALAEFNVFVIINIIIIIL